MKNVPLGICSCCVAALVWLGMCVGAVAIVSYQLFFFKSQTGQQILAIWFYGGLGMALLGVLLSVVGLTRNDQKKTFAVLGLLLNGLALLGSAGVFYLSK